MTHLDICSEFSVESSLFMGATNSMLYASFLAVKQDLLLTCAIFRAGRSDERALFSGVNHDREREILQCWRQIKIFLE
ncbi:MAG: hypothetical protein HUJ26_08060 [Planctomycetaceae bacterium]|nr:hypothetical protein [Planctomycetaceae bacterium]